MEATPCDLARVLESAARCLSDELLIIIFEPLTGIELARLACVHRRFKGVWDAMRAAAPQARVFSLYVPRTLLDPPTPATLAWLAEGKHDRLQRAAVVGDVHIVKSARIASPVSLVHFCLTTDQLGVFQVLASRVLDRHKDKEAKFIRFARVAAYYGANTCLAWLFGERYMELNVEKLDIMIRETIAWPGCRASSLPCKMAPKPALRDFLCTTTNTGALDIFYTRWNEGSLRFRWLYPTFGGGFHGETPTPQERLDSDHARALGFVCITKQQCKEAMECVFSKTRSFRWINERSVAHWTALCREAGKSVGAAFLEDCVVPRVSGRVAP